MIIKRIISILAAFSISFLLTSCFSNPYKVVQDAQKNIYETQESTNDEFDRLYTSEPAVKVDSGYYVNTAPQSLDGKPTWLKNHINVRAQDIPFNLIVSRILRNTNATVTLQNGVQGNQNISLDYDGTIKGALDQLAAQTNYAYEARGNSIIWQALVTKTFNVSFMPGTSNYLVGQTSGGGNGSTSGTSSGDISTVKGDLGSDQYSNIQGQLSVWKDLRATLEQLKSPDGKVSVSESTTTVTVVDRPSNIRAMERYISQLNRTMSRQVAIQVTVLEFTLSKEFNYGIDWNLIQNWFGTQISFIGQTGTAASATGNIATSGTSGVFTIQAGTDANNAILRALSQQGQVAIVTQPTVTTMNNQVAEIRITRDTSYLQSVSTTVVANSGAGPQTSLTPGVVTDGFSLYILPKIQGDKVYLSISSTLSVLTQLQTISGSTGAVSTTGAVSDTATTSEVIQLPTMTEKHFNQRAALQNGATLIITGFQQLTDKINTVAPFGVEAFGGKGALSDNTQTIICITPMIVYGAT